MEIYALIGASGTGKSHRAPLLAFRLNIPYIIDDGLLIKGNRILAGRSAKRERTRYGAIKRALFNDPEHAAQVKEKLDEIKPEKLLILATSRRMSQTIAERLDLPHPHHYIMIEEIATPEAIQTALSIREKENRHVVPLPTFAIKRDFPGYLIDPFRSIFHRPPQRGNKFAVERSIVRPIYSSLGNFYIAEHMVSDLVSYIAAQVPGVFKAHRVEVQSNGNNVTLNVELVLEYQPGREPDLPHILKTAQREIKEKIEYQTGFYLEKVNIIGKKLHHLPADEPAEPAVPPGLARSEQIPVPSQNEDNPLANAEQ